MALLLIAGMFTFYSCDSDPVEGEPKTVYTYFLSANDEAKNLLDMKFSTSGSGASMVVLLQSIKADHPLYSSKGYTFEGKVPSYMTAMVQCELKDDASLTKDNYVFDIRLTSTVTTYDADGKVTAKKNYISKASLKEKNLTKAEVEETFKKHVLSIIIDAKTDNQGYIQPSDSKNTQEQ